MSVNISSVLTARSQTWLAGEVNKIMAKNKIRSKE
jgi:hypothetical protein